MVVGEILLNPAHYVDRQTGESKPKYFLILALSRSGDLIVRLLTSRVHGRPEQPRCFHGDPYPSFYLGILGGRLSDKSWLDLRGHPDLDCGTVQKKLQAGQMEVVTTLDRELLAAAMDCAAAAPDTALLQERSIRDSLAQLRS